MHDIKFIRENPESFDAGLQRRGMEPAASAILELDAERRAVATRLQDAQNRRNEASKAIGAAKARKADEEAAALMAEVAGLKQTLPALEAEEKALAARLHDQLARLPNLPDAAVPDGVDEAGNVELSRWGFPRAFDFAPREHDELGRALGMDFDAAGTVSGARFVYLKGPIARLNRALGQYMLDHQTQQHGYTEMRAAAAGAHRGAVRHRPIAQIRRRSVPDHRRPLADPYRRGEPHQLCPRADPARGRICRCASPR